MPEEKVFPSEVSTTDEEEDDDGVLSPEPTVVYFDPNGLDFENPDSIEMNLSRKKALLDFRCRVEDAILSNRMFGRSKAKFSSTQKLADFTIWGVPLLPSKGHESTDLVLMKFLKAADFKVCDAYDMLRRTLKWRLRFEPEKGCDEKLVGPEFGNLVYVTGEDRSGRPLLYNIFGEFKDRELCNKVIETEAFVRWKVHTLEMVIQKLRLKPGVADSIIQITDLKNSPGPAVREIRALNKKTEELFQEHYPELVYRNIYINVPFWYFVSHSLHSQKGKKSNFVFARPARVTQALLKYISPENIPLQYGGLLREKDDEFSTNDQVFSLNVRGSSTQTLQVPVEEPGVTIVWDLTVIGFEVSYKEEFIPDDDCSYNVLIQGDKKMRESVRNSFYIYEPGKIVITISNGTAKKKKIFFRHKSKPTLPVYMLN